MMAGEDFIFGLLIGVFIPLILILDKWPWIKLAHKNASYLFSVNKSDRGKIARLPKNEGSFTEVQNPNGRGIVQEQRPSIWVPELKARFFLHYTDQYVTIPAKHAAAASLLKQIGIKKDDKVKTDESKIDEAQRKADAHPTGVDIDLKDSIDWFSHVVNPVEVERLAMDAGVRFSGLMDLITRKGKGDFWGYMKWILIIGGIGFLVIFFLPGILSGLGGLFHV